MPRKRAQYDANKSYPFLNSKDDLTAVIHGLSSMEALADEALEALLLERGLRGDALANLRFLEKVEVLIAADRLDAETHDLFAHLIGIRNRFAHQMQTDLTPGDGKVAWDRLPDRAKTTVPLRMKRTSPAREVVRWCIVVLAIRLLNRSVRGHEANIPYS